MKNLKIFGSIIMLSILLSLKAFAASNIDTTDKYAWSENSGWLNFNGTNNDVTVYSDHLEGYVWAENIGFIRLGTYTSGGTHTYANTSNTDYGINNNSGTLEGYAWSENVGWIKFDDSNGGVTIDANSGDFDGYAWAENVGWIHFNNASPAYKVRKLLPEMDVEGNNISITDGDTTASTNDDTDFGSVVVGNNTTKTFTIKNTGGAELNLTDSPIVSVTGNGFSVTTQPSSPVAVTNGETTFVVEFAPTTTGEITGEISIANDDSDENPYNFAIQGTAPDTTAPTTTTLTPADDATNIAIDSNLVIEFDEIVNVNSGNILIKLTSDDSVVATIQVTDAQVTGTGTNTITINPTTDLNYGTDYYVEIDSGAFQDAANNDYAGISDKTDFNFTTEAAPDTTAPTTTTLTPADDATNIAIDSNLVIEFDEIVNVNSGNILIKLTSDDSVVATIPVTDAQVTGTGTNTITINLTTDLNYGTDYYVEIEAGAFRDAANNDYAGITDKTDFNFTTEAAPDTTAPTTTTFTPADDATNIAIDSNLVIEFDEIVNVNSGNILIKLTSDDSEFATIPVTDAQVTGTGTNTITINPTTDLNYGTLYYVEIEAGAFRDAANNDYAGITDKTTWNFTTKNLYIPPPIQQTTPEPTVCSVGASNINCKIKNEGTISDVKIEPEGSIEGGTLEGQITNEGTLTNVSLAAGTKIEGGQIQGQINGNPEAPAILINVKITANTQLSNVILETNVELPNDVTLKNVELRGASVNGGKLEGSIRTTSSATVIKNVSLGENATIIGGKLAGTISGTPKNPAILEHLTVEPQTLLTNVTISDGVEMPADVILASGVRFTTTENMPAGVDLTETLPKKGQSVDLSADPVIGGEGILAAINRLQEFVSPELTVLQHEKGFIYLDVKKGIRYAVNPIKVKHLSETERLQLESGQTVRFKTDTQIDVLAPPAIQDISSFKATLIKINLPEVNISNDGNIKVLALGTVLDQI